MQSHPGKQSDDESISRSDRRREVQDVSNLPATAGWERVGVIAPTHFCRRVFDRRRSIGGLERIRRVTSWEEQFGYSGYISEGLLLQRDQRHPTVYQVPKLQIQFPQNRLKLRVRFPAEREINADQAIQLGRVGDHRLGYHHARRTYTIAAFDFIHHIFGDDF